MLVLAGWAGGRNRGAPLGERSAPAFSGRPLEAEREQCQCEQLLAFQSLASEEARKLGQRHILPHTGLRPASGEFATGAETSRV